MIDLNELKNIDNILALIDSIDIPEIDTDTNFWLIRTESGIFYDEYIENNFVALAWNEIKAKEVNKANSSEEIKEKICNKIESTYGSKRPGGILNKCDRFINEIKENDIFMIPSKENKQIAFALAGEYYEENNLKSSEAEFLTFKKDGWTETFKDKGCPYSKRRTIKILKKINEGEINPNLYKALVSHHGLNNINKYSDYILSSIFPLYLHNETLSVVFRVKAKDVQALPYSSFVYHLAKYVKNIDANKEVSIRTNINSPGDIVLEFFHSAKDFLKTALPYLIITWICLTGGKTLGFEINSLIKIINETLNDRSERQLKELEAEEKRIKIESDKIDLEQKKEEHKLFLENLKKEKTKDQLSELSKTAKPLDIDTQDFKSVINISKYKENKKRDK